MARTPAIPTALIITGAYLAWFGVHYWRADPGWPSEPVKAVLTGKPLPEAHKSGAALLTTSVVGPGLEIFNDVTASGIGGATPSTSGTLTKEQIKALWTGNGGNPAAANTAAAIALAESSGRAGVLSQNPDGGTNVGLWQLDTKGVGAGYSVAQLSDPATNARVTVMGSLNGTRWGAWQTYVEGTYRQYL